MNISINIESVPEEERFRLYQFLKNRFETKPKEEVLKMDPSEFLRRGDISRRTCNLLKSIKIQSLLELSQFSKYDFPKFRGFGKGTLKEIENLLNKYGLQFYEE
ncbi:MAG: hypothetical protein BGO55_06280 [Sphingobacteriales bacterium 50-39]|nr:hypothetical protein [Sphingobacteriales bacterium]OJW52869.1 MAG: hypothetical protein BGO55_06280 [Sphingobacteriales bacterium 50-39]